MASRLNLLTSFVLISFLLRCCERGVNVEARTSAKNEKTSPGRRSATFPNGEMTPLDANPKMKRTLSSSRKDLHTLLTTHRSTSHSDLRNFAKLKDSAKRDAADFKKSFEREKRSSSQVPRIANSVWASSSDLAPQEDLQPSLPRKAILSKSNLRVTYRHQSPHFTWIFIEYPEINNKKGEFMYTFIIEQAK